jgi:RNA polymerase sigma-70 factor (ECF subfamily)
MELLRANELVRFSTDWEEDIVQRVNLGDQSAIEELFHKYYDGLCKFTARLINSTEDVEDLVQDIFVRIWVMRKEWHPRGSIKTYLFRAAHNQAANFIKSKRVKDTIIVETVDEAAFSSGLSPLEELDNNDVSSVVKRAIERLPKKCKLIFTLSRQEGLSYSEISNVLGISEKTVENQIVRALKRLRKELKDLAG